MTQVADLPPLRRLLDAHDLSPTKALGQNFLLDLNLTARIARAADPLDGCHVAEIGPGPGGLTRALLESPAASLTLIEKDPRTAPILAALAETCLLYTSPSPRDATLSRMPSSA